MVVIPGRQDDRVESQRGQALLLALVVLLLVSIALSIVAGALAYRQKAVQENVREVELRALTDAALARTLAELERRRDYRGLAEEDFGSGRISSQVRALSGTRVEVLAIARHGELQRAVRAEVYLPIGAPPRVARWERSVPPERDR